MLIRLLSITVLAFTSIVPAANLPSQVSSQLSALETTEWLNQPALTIGPRYPQGWSTQFIAADYAYGINRLVRNRQLSSSSPFVTSALSSLTTFLQTQGGASSVPLDFVGLASGSLELEIANAMKISLQ